MEMESRGGMRSPSGASALGRALGKHSPKNDAWTSTTFILLCFCMIVDKADQIMLPAVFLQICQEFNAGPAFLGTVTLCRGLAQAVVALACGPLSAQYNRIKIVGCGCIIWGIASFGCALAGGRYSLLFFRAINGIGLGLAIPVIQAIVSDLFPPLERGRAFGALNFMDSFGGTVGGLFATSVAGGIVVGISGWRFAFHSVALISVGLGSLVLQLGVDPPPNSEGVHAAKQKMDFTLFWAEFKDILKLPTFQVIIAQGSFGTMPWYAISFFVMWLQLTGFTNVEAASIRSAFDIGCTICGAGSGFVVDWAGKVSPDHGRAYCAQFMSGIGVPLWLFILYGMQGSSASTFAAVLFMTGLLIAGCGNVNNAVMADTTPPHLRSTIFGLDRVFEGILGASAAALTGIIAEVVFGFKSGGGCGTAPSNSTGTPDPDGVSQADNADALGSALAWLMVPPWAICFLAFTGLHFVYATDRDKALAMQRAAAAKAAGGGGLNAPTGDGATPGVGSAIVTHTYTPSHDRGLDCHAGEPVTVLRLEPEWVRVRNLKGSEGWVPQSFLKMGTLEVKQAAGGGLGEGLTGGLEGATTAL